jgi:hypothetical protein
MDLRNWEFFIDNGNPVVGATVNVRAATLSHPNTGTVLATTTTDANGMWVVTGLTPTPKDIEVIWGNLSQYHKWYKGQTQHNVEVVFSGPSDTGRRKNRLINGDFPLWQRGTNSPTTTDNAYGPDQWRLLTETSATGHTLGWEVSDVPLGGSHYAAKLGIGATANKKGGLFQPLPGSDIYDLRGQTASLSFWLKASDARIGDVRASVVQWTGTENAISADPINVWGSAGTVPTYTGSWSNAATPTNLNPITSWMQYRIEGVPISASATNLAAFIWIEDQSTNTADYILLTDVQLEKGSYASDFDRRPVTQELTRAQAYFETTYPTTPAVFPVPNTYPSVLIFNGASIGAGQYYGQYSWKVKKFSAPSVTYYSYAGTAGRSGNNVGADYAASSAIATTISEWGADLQNNSGGALTVTANIVLLNYVASAVL